MNIILVSNKMAKTKTLSMWQVVMFMLVLLLIAITITAFVFKPVVVIEEATPIVLTPEEVEENLAESQMHLDAYAKQIGELQARIVRLDAQNQRLVKLAGVDGSKSGKKSKTAKNIKSPDALNPKFGGPLVGATPMTEEDLQAAVSELVEAVDNRDDYLSGVEADVLRSSVLKDMLPNSRPIKAAYNSSSFGWRTDPFSKRRAFHEGLDFTANMGTPIRAAADGIVTASGRNAAYGNLVKINHGAGLETRYAHASKLLVKRGERVVKGQVIAKVGSTGRSTGPHLHYEIRLNGHALNPKKYLK